MIHRHQTHDETEAREREKRQRKFIVSDARLYILLERKFAVDIENDIIA